MASIYRKTAGYQTWHFCSNCSHCPEADYEELLTPPGTGELCNECKTLRQGEIANNPRTRCKARTSFSALLF